MTHNLYTPNSSVLKHRNTDSTINSLHIQEFGPVKLPAVMHSCLGVAFRELVSEAVSLKYRNANNKTLFVSTFSNLLYGVFCKYAINCCQLLVCMLCSVCKWCADFCFGENNCIVTFYVIFTNYSP